MNAFLLFIATLLLSCSVALAEEDYLGQYSANPYKPESTSNTYGAGSPFEDKSINNPNGDYGSEYSNKSATNPYATNAPKLYDDEGNYRGRLSANPYDPESTSNPFGKYGSQFSSDSINNQFGAGSQFKQDSPNNQFGHGMKLYDGNSDGPAESEDSADLSTYTSPVVPKIEPYSPPEPVSSYDWLTKDDD